MPQETHYDTKRIILLGVLLFLIIAGIGYFIFKKKSSDQGTSSNTNLFPFDPNNPNRPGEIDEQTPGSTENPVVENKLTNTTGERLRRITTYPITSYFPFVKNITSTEPKYDEVTRQTVMTPVVQATDYVRYNAQQNGFLADAELTPDTITIQQRSNLAIPLSQEVWYSNQGNTIIFRTWDSTKQKIVSFSGSLPTPKPLAFCTQAFTKILKKGDRGNEVKEIQKYMNGKFSQSLKVDGIFGGKTFASVKAMQHALAITETGVYDQTTIDALNADCAKINSANTESFEGIQKLTGDFVKEGILRGTVSPDGTQIFFLIENTNGVTGYLADAYGKTIRSIFSSPLTEWKPLWVNKDTISMTTLASSEAAGFLYTLNPQTGSFQKKLGPVQGLTTLLSPDGIHVLISESADRGIHTSLYNLTNGTSTTLDLVTLPEKCTWSNNTNLICAVPQRISSGQYPDDWYQGNATFNDSFWSLDSEKGTTSQIVTPSQSFDAYELHMSPQGTYFYFINKGDGNLWSYRLGE